jgi:hypothetical protein
MTWVTTTKRARLLALMAAGDWRAALSLAAKFADLGDHEEAIRAGHEAMQRPDFQRQIGRDPEAAVAAGIAALKARYGDGA